MKGLVAYDSSSDEETGPGNAPATKASASTEPSAQNGQTEQNGVDTAVPAAEIAMVGPSMPIEAFEGPSIEDLNDLPSTMSEQDLVRHLTQASHPMAAIPPSPPGSPNPATDTRLKRFLDLKATGLHFNEDLARKNNFRNPALFSNLSDRVGLAEHEQYGTSISPSLYGLSEVPLYAYKEDLARNQQSIRDQQAARKKQAAAAGKRTIEFAAAGASGTSSRTSTPGSQRKGVAP